MLTPVGVLVRYGQTRMKMVKLILMKLLNSQEMDVVNIRIFFRKILVYIQIMIL